VGAVWEAPSYGVYDALDDLRDKCVLCDAWVYTNPEYNNPGRVTAMVATAWRLGGMKAVHEVVKRGTPQWGRVDDYIYALEEMEADANG
jgi:hypothetical protein